MSSAGVSTLSPVLRELLLSPNGFHTPHFSLDDEFIFIYLSYLGSLTPMRVLPCDTIESVKLKIQRTQGLPSLTNKKKLVCGGRELARSNSLLKDYGVIEGNVLHLVIRHSDIQTINVRTSCGKEFTFQAERCRDVGYVKQQIAKWEKQFADPEQQEVVCNGEQLEDQRLIDDICSKHSDAVIHLFVRMKYAEVRTGLDELSVVAAELNDTKNYDEIVPRNAVDRDLLLEPVIVNPKIELASEIWNMINSTYDGLDSGNYPIRSAEGTGGAYFMLDSTGQRYVSVFKPIDEEPMAVNNPRGLPLSLDGEGLKKGTRVGQGAFREVAAYILDHPITGRRSLFGDEKGFAGVPPTVMVKCLHNGFNHSGDWTAKIGSLQMFMENNGSCEDMGPGAFPVKEVHKISVLDIRLANADRHAGNILLSKEDENDQAVLIPIDHGYCLPTSFEDCTFEWLYWPQARQSYSPEIIDYIKSLDAEEDIALLKFHGWDLPVECARTLQISTMLLKKGVERGMTPFAIGSLMCRESLNKESVIEGIVKAALDSVLPGTTEATFLDAVSDIMDQRLDGITSSIS
ncbi:phosphatidylinositol 4-kinase gamma 4-like isoform X2 [Gastrolobium bilobum]|uniref:phosphatidylinositol 4-kinase gamma 4-like isoform X2 n=1 Tax=Gastrolobium bilobum TaxID=150636 RepID=UPI002AB2F1F7|nr:phosphatidylinositol 4-kinase gamma 4-like isoform X2 [Gastrolobium bilobum]